MTWKRALINSLAEEMRPVVLTTPKSINLCHEKNKAEHLITGETGEDMAAAFLLAKGFKITARNVRYPCGEIDIIAEDGDEIVFVEVRTRRIGVLMPPAATVGPSKLKKLIRAARMWTEGRNYEGFWRIDLVAITINEDHTPIFEYIGDITEGIL